MNEKKQLLKTMLELTIENKRLKEENEKMKEQKAKDDIKRKCKRKYWIEQNLKRVLRYRKEGYEKLSDRQIYELYGILDILKSNKEINDETYNKIIKLTNTIKKRYKKY